MSNIRSEGAPHRSPRRRARRAFSGWTAKAAILGLVAIVLAAVIRSTNPAARPAARSPAPPSTVPRSPTPTPAPAGGVSSAPVESSPPDLATLKLVNYFPAAAAWINMWLSWDPAQIDRDFATLAGWSANGVRLVVEPSAFGWPEPEATMASRLAETVGLAQAHGLRVGLSLFDWWGSYQDLTDSDQWARAIVAPFRHDPRIAFIELQNEIRPEKAAAMAWARHELPIVRQAAGNIPITVSVTDSPGFTVLQELQALKTALASNPPDFYDLHLYAYPGSAYTTLAQAKALVAPTPLFVGEVGLSSYATSAAARTRAEALQDQFFRTIEWATAQLDLPAAAPWIMQDFTSPGVPVEAGLPPSGYHYGLVRADGTPKPAVSTIREFFMTHRAGTDFNNSFEGGAGGLPTVWQVFRPMQGSFAWDTTVAHSGRASVRIRGTTGTAAASPSFWATPVIGPTRPGARFDATVWSKGIGATGTTTIGIRWFDDSNAELSSSDSAPLPNGATNWTQLSLLTSAPAGSAYAQIYLQSSGNAGTVWFDDVTFDDLTLDH